MHLPAGPKNPQRRPFGISICLRTKCTSTQPTEGFGIQKTESNAEKDTEPIIIQRLIRQDPANAELLPSLRCLMCLVEERKADVRALYSYAAENLHEQLRSAVLGPGDNHDEGFSPETATDDESGSTDEEAHATDRSLEEPFLQAQVGGFLTRLFAEDNAIDSLLGFCYPLSDDRRSILEMKELPASWSAWIMDDKAPDLLRRSLSRNTHVRGTPTILDTSFQPYGCPADVYTNTLRAFEKLVDTDLGPGFESFERIRQRKTERPEFEEKVDHTTLPVEKLSKQKEVARDTVLQSLEMMLNEDSSDEYQCFWQLQALFWTLKDFDSAVAAVNMLGSGGIHRACENKRSSGKKQMIEWKRRNELNNNNSSGEFRIGEHEANTAKSQDDAPDTHAAPPPTASSAELAPGEYDDEGQESEKPEEPTYRIGVFHDGCDEDFDNPNGMWTCINECGQVQFDEKCVKTLREGTLKKFMCNKDHLLEKFPEQEFKVENMAKDKVRVNGKLLSLKAWAEIIRKEYVAKASKK
ncbi:hypothetical protein CSAL01_11656 [Colletotrichum salicis]|uniref:Uncharacterized protein n=1 Tax=Colletotrichum salicis TaxID=1209931 RepID=A0A135UGW8_9PEZI|nr:hypothetical protein CSAL01_11656 [Colletotrichum salicis]